MDLFLFVIPAAIVFANYFVSDLRALSQDTPVLARCEQRG